MSLRKCSQLVLAVMDLVQGCYTDAVAWQILQMMELLNVKTSLCRNRAFVFVTYRSFDFQKPLRTMRLTFYGQMTIIRCLFAARSGASSASSRAGGSACVVPYVCTKLGALAVVLRLKLN